MSDDPHHRGALIETAGLQLDRAHLAATTMAGGEVRRGLSLALIALRDAARSATGDDVSLNGIISRLEEAMADLEAGKLADMERLIETARTDLRA